MASDREKREAMSSASKYILQGVGISCLAAAPAVLTLNEIHRIELAKFSIGLAVCGVTFLALSVVVKLLEEIRDLLERDQDSNF